MTPARRKQKRMHMLMWAMLTLPIRQDWSWRYLIEWAALGGVKEDGRG